MFHVLAVMKIMNLVFGETKPLCVKCKTVEWLVEDT